MAKQKARLAGIGARAKAFIIDLFLIGMPIYYLTTYVFLGGKDDFLHNQTAIFGANLAGLCLCFFRKDALNLHDLLTHSAAVCKKAE